MKTLHHTETTWQGRKIIIDAADLTAEYGYIEVMAMYPDGREIEYYHTHDPEDARLMFNHYCDLAADRPTADTYTRQDWHRDGTLRPHKGQAITAEVYNEMLNRAPTCKLPRDLRGNWKRGYVMTVIAKTRPATSCIWPSSPMACGTSIMGLYASDALAGMHRIKQPRPITQNLKGANTHDYRN